MDDVVRKVDVVTQGTTVNTIDQEHGDWCLYQTSVADAHEFREISLCYIIQNKSF